MFYKITALLVSALLFTTSCSSTVDIENTTETQNDSGSQSTHASPMQVSRIIKDKLYINIQSNRATSSAREKEIIATLEGVLAEYGFGINELEEPFLSISISANATQLAKYGNAYRFKSAAAVSMRRLDNKLIGRKKFSHKGDRTHGLSQAEAASFEGISETMATWIEEKAQVATKGLNSSVIKVDLDDFDDRWFDYRGRAIKKSFNVNNFTRLATALPGVFSCQLIKTEDDKYSFRVIYMTKYFPNGLVSRSLNSNDVKVDKKNPLKSLVEIIFNSHQ